MFDVQGSTAAINDSYHYDTFGELTTANGSDRTAAAQTDYLYTGQQFDALSELYNLRARSYDPSVGRFLSRDTWSVNYQNPLEYNRYVYAQTRRRRISE